MSKNDYIRKLQARKAAGQYQKEVLLRERERIAGIKAAERALWLHSVAINRAFGIGRTRLLRDYFPIFEEISAEYTKRLTEVDRDYADGKLEEEFNRIYDADIEIGGAENWEKEHVKDNM